MCRPGYDYMSLYSSDCPHWTERYDRREYKGLERKTEIDGKLIKEVWDKKRGEWIKVG